MRKTLLASIVCASVFAVPAFAQVNLGAAAQVGTHAGAALPLGAPVHDSMGMASQVGARAGDNARGVSQQTRHATHKTVHQTAAATRRDAYAATNANANASAQAGDSNAHADVGLHSATAAGAAGDAGRGMGGDVRDAAHSAIQSTDRTAGSVGDAAKNAADNAAAKDTVGVDANVKAKGGVHGH